jgi:hypothetical protein
MADSEDFFNPKTVDEQIEQLSLSGDNSSISQGATPDTRLISDLQHVYQVGRGTDARSLDSAWERIEREYNAPPRQLHLPQERT